MTYDFSITVTRKFSEKKALLLLSLLVAVLEAMGLSLDVDFTCGYTIKGK